MTFLPSLSTLRPALTLFVCVIGLLVMTTSCDFGAAKNAVQSVSPTVSLPTTETTISGRAVEATTGALLQTSADLQFQGPNSDALLNMYGDPVSALTLYSGAISLGVRERPSQDNPVRFQVVATADGYQSTSESVQLVAPGTKQFRLDLLSEDPTDQPEGAFGTRQRFDQIENGHLQANLLAETPSAPSGSNIGLSIPKGTALYEDNRPVGAPLVVDLVHYSVTDELLEALPGNGILASDAAPSRFSTMGYLNRQLRAAEGDDVSGLTPANGTKPTMRVRLPDDAVNPSSGTTIQAGDPIELFRFDPTTGAWRPDTTVTVQLLSSGAAKHAAQRRASSGSSLGIQWSLQRSLQTRWWAWGHRSPRSCVPNKTIQVNTNEQFGNVELRLRRPGLQYQRSVSLDALRDDGGSLSTLLDQPTIPNHADYTLTLQTRDGQSRTVSSITPCGGTQSVTLPAPTDQTPRSDVLVQAIPTCPATQHIRLTSAPKVMVYYRELGTTGWNTAGSNHVTWIKDDPNSPTYIKRAELTLDGLKQGARYEFTTTYGQDQYEAAVEVPRRKNATIKDGRAVVKYDRPLPNVCS